MGAGLLDPARDPVAVERPEGFERLEHHQRERPLPDVGFVSHQRSALSSQPSALSPRPFVWVSQRRVSHTTYGIAIGKLSYNEDRFSDALGSTAKSDSRPT